IGYSPAYDLAAVNIDGGKHVHEPTEHGYVGNIRLPDLVCAVDFQVPEQIGEFIISLIGLAEILFGEDRKSTRLNSSHVKISYAVFCLKKKTLIFYLS